MIEKGTLLRCKTTTKEDKFGTVIWEVVETGLQAPEKGREDFKDGVKVVMLGGSGPSARAGMTLIDSEAHIFKDMVAGITTIISAEQREAMLQQVKRSDKKDTMSRRHGGTGVIEL
jgi:hypothetical protein